MDQRVQFDFEVDFLNGGGIQGQDYRLDIADDEISDAQLAGIVTYVQYLHHPQDRGGVGLAHTGPIAEGFVGLLVGLAGVVGIAAWVGHRTDDEPLERHA